MNAGAGHKHTKFAADTTGSYYEGLYVGKAVVQFGTEYSPSMKVPGLRG